MQVEILAWTPKRVVAVPLRRKDGSVKAFAWIDKKDAKRVLAHKWCLNTHGYAHCRLPDDKWVRLHRFILRVIDPKLDVDHINRRRLDCRRSNMRVLTRQQNRQNTGLRSNRSSQYRGVTWDSPRQLWKAQATVNYQHHFLGRFKAEADAGAVVAAFRREHMPFSID